MPKAKKSRKPKTSSGLGIKHRRSPQTPTQLIMMDKGLMVGVSKRWRGN